MGIDKLTIEGVKWVTIYVEKPETPIPEEYETLTIQIPEGMGSTVPTAGTIEILKGSKITITANPGEGWFFDKWIYDGEEKRENPLVLQF